MSATRGGPADVTCCPRPYRVPGPVDRVLGGNLRLRHLPGEICLTCHDVTAPPVAAAPYLDHDIRACLAGVAPHLTVLKIRPQHRTQSDSPTLSSPSMCRTCGEPTEFAAVDVALGAHG